MLHSIEEFQERPERPSKPPGCGSSATFMPLPLDPLDLTRPE